MLITFCTGKVTYSSFMSIINLLPVLYLPIHTYVIYWPANFDAWYCITHIQPRR